MSDERLTPLQQTLYEAAQSEAKRLGAETATVVHMAIALARREPNGFDALLGEGAATRLKASRTNLPGDAPDALAVLTAAEDTTVDGAIRAVVAAMPTLVDFVKAPAAEPAETPAAAPEPEEPATLKLPGAAGRLARIVEPDTGIVGRDAAVDDLLSLLFQRHPATPIVVGPAGSGKTALLGAIAARLESRDEEQRPPVVRVGVDLLLGESPAPALDQVLDSLTAGQVVAIDDLDAALALGTGSAVHPMIMRLRAAVDDGRLRLLLLVDEKFVSRLAAVDDEFMAELVRVDLPSLSLDELRSLAVEAAAEYGEYHGVEIPDQVAWLAMAPASRHDRQRHPGLLMDRLDRAGSRAALRGSVTVEDADLALAADGSTSPLSAEAVGDSLRERVRGQDEAIDLISRRLALTRAQLDLRPDRPDGVFLLVGPTGVGKTELARALCATLHATGEDALIRLDMSEYSGSWALSRLIGPQPGYVGSTQPESWLTTRVIAEPESVVLLDEIEKAHHEVWNAFLQVFDAGRLTDSKGNVADFSRTVMLMTSNIGAGSFNERPALGFAPETETDDAALDRVRAAVEATMPPELVNRLDAVIVFRPLSDETLLEITNAELRRLGERLAGRGYQVTFEPGVAELIASIGRDVRYGARHVQRNIEKQLLESLTVITDRDLVAGVTDDQIRWRTREAS